MAEPKIHLSIGCYSFYIRTRWKWISMTKQKIGGWKHGALECAVVKKKKIMI